MTLVTVSDAQRRLSELLAAEETGALIVIDGGKGRVFRLSAHERVTAVIPDWAGCRNPGSAEGLIRIEDEFDEPLEELSEYAE